MNQEQLDNLIAEKIALDQMYTAIIKELHECKKQIILKDDKIQKLVNEASRQAEEIKNLMKELDEAKEAQLHVIGLESEQPAI